MREKRKKGRVRRAEKNKEENRKAYACQVCTAITVGSTLDPLRPMRETRRQYPSVVRFLVPPVPHRQLARGAASSVLLQTLVVGLVQSLRAVRHFFWLWRLLVDRVPHLLVHLFR
jgi:hypothetical protein